MTIADTIERPRTEMTEAEVLEKLQAIYERDRKRDWRAKVDRLDAIRHSFADQRQPLLSPQLRDRITKTIESERQKDPRGPGIRYKSLAEAKKAGVDLSALKKLHDGAYHQFDEVVKGPGAFKYHETVVGSVTDILERPPIIFNPPDPDKEKLFFPPFGGAWDRTADSQATGDGAVTENASYLDGNGRMGSRLVAHNHDAGDIDLLCAYRENGYLVPFKTLKTGILQVKADLTALLCRHHIATVDEWGWSDFHAVTSGRLVMAAFWKWEDVNPANEVSHQWFVSGLDCRGDGESFPGTTNQAVPGERRIINLFSDMAFPAGIEVWVYVGVADRIWALLNDVKISMSVDSAWLLNSLAIRSI